MTRQNDSAFVSLDLLVAVILVLTVLILALQIIPALNPPVPETNMKQVLTATRTSDMLIGDRGWRASFNDTYWEESWNNSHDASRIGFALEENLQNILDENKVSALMYKHSNDTLLNWWDNSWLYRKRINITNKNTLDLSNNSSVNITVNTTSLNASGKMLPNGNDLRIAYWNSASWVELDRILDESSSWNNASTKIWFKTQAPISPGAYDNNYYLYYDNPSATSPPTNMKMPTRLRSVQNGTITIASGSTIANATLSQAVNTTKAFLVFGVSENSTDPANGQVSGQITNSTTVTFQRVGTTTDVTVKWYVAEFTSGVAVQRGSRYMSDTNFPVTENVTLSPSVNSTKSFPIISARAGGTTYEANDFARANITNSTNLQLSARAGNAAMVVEWQVVEYTDANVQTGDLSFASTDSSRTTTPFSSVNTSKSWLIYTYEITDLTGVNIGPKLLHGKVTNGTTLTFDRDATGDMINLTWYLVEFTGDTIVQHNNQSFTTTETQKNVTFTSINTTRSIAAGGYFMRGGKSPYSADDNPGVGWFTFNLTNASNLQITRDTTGFPAAGAEASWFVVEFGLAEPNTSLDLEEKWMIGTVPWWDYPIGSESQTEKDSASKALGLSNYSFYIQLRPLNESLFDVVRANNNITKNVPDSGAAVVERYVFIRGSEALVNASGKTAGYRLVLWVW